MTQDAVRRSILRHGFIVLHQFGERASVEGGHRADAATISSGFGQQLETLQLIVGIQALPARGSHGLHSLIAPFPHP